MRAVVVSLAFAVGVAACGTSTAPTAVPAPVATRSAAPASPEAAVVTPTPSPTAKPTTKPKPTTVARLTPSCLAADLAARVTLWEGAMGHRIASVTLTNTSSSPCIVQGTPELQLLGHYGAVLIDSRTEGPSGLPHVSPGAPAFRLARSASLTTQVDTDNYCGFAPTLPTTVAFILPSGPRRLVAAPGPGGGVPPCLGAPGSAGLIAMNGWRR